MRRVRPARARGRRAAASCALASRKRREQQENLVSSAVGFGTLTLSPVLAVWRFPGYAVDCDLLYRRSPCLHRPRRAAGRTLIAAGRLSKPSSASFSTCRTRKRRERDRERLERLLHASLHATAGLPRSGPYDALAAAQHVEDGFEPVSGISTRAGSIRFIVTRAYDHWANGHRRASRIDRIQPARVLIPGNGLEAVFNVLGGGQRVVRP